MKRSHGVSYALPIVVLAMLCLPAVAVVREYVEDFTTKDYCDTLNTTADWNTTAGEVGLHEFELTMAGALATPGSAREAAIAGNVAYLASGSAGVHVLDISDPANPSLLATVDTPGSAITCVVAGDYAYVADNLSGLQVMDITAPVSSFIAGSYDMGTAADIAISGDYAYLADDGARLVVIDISDPTTPTLSGTCVLPGAAHGVAVEGDYAYVAYWTGVYRGIYVVDVSVPASPDTVGNWISAGLPKRIAIEGNRAFVASSNYGLEVIDISDPTNPVGIGICDTPGRADALCVTGDYAYIADNNFGIQVVDISDPTSPSIIMAYDTPGSAYGVAVAGEYAYVGDYSGGFLVLHICDYRTPFVTGDCDVSSRGGMDVVTAGDLAFVAQSDDGLLIVDISDPTSPQAVGMCDTYQALGVAVAGDCAYVGDGSDGLKVIDVADPTNPVIIGSYNTPDRARGVSVAGDHAFVCDADSGLLILDISDPTNPVLTGTCDTPGLAFSVALAGDHAFVADYSSGLQVVDISDPAAPVLSGSVDTPGLARAIAIAGDYAFVADYDSGLQVVDISDPTSPTLVGGCDVLQEAQGVSVAGDLLFMTEPSAYYGGPWGLVVLDISDPANPAIVASAAIADGARAIHVAGDYAYVVTSSASDMFLSVAVFDRSFVPSAASAQSLDVEPLGANALSAVLSSAHEDSVRWELSCDGGSSWVHALSGEKHWFGAPGGEILWRSTHTYVGEGLNPACTDLHIEWEYELPQIDFVTDIPGDQGGQVRLAWTRTGYDVVESPTPVTQYAIYRRIDGGAREGDGAGKLPDGVVDEGASGSPERYPPGDWHYVTAVPARAEEEYSTVVPTLVDSTVGGDTGYSVFFLRAMTDTPWVYFDSPPDSGYSVDNIAPAMPTGFALEYNATQNFLSWDESPDADFQYFRIYRSDTPGFTHGPGNLIHMTIDTSWVDYVGDGWSYYYKLTAVDFAGNESDAASPETVTHGDRDFGDAPDPPYPTFEASNGALHYIWPGIFLGAGVDAEIDGQPDSLALGDDNDGNDDDDGVAVLTPLVPGVDVDVEVVASVPGYVGLWLDADHDGMLDAMLTDTPVSAGANTLSFHLDALSPRGETYMRVRFTTYPGYTAVDGAAPDGEVEDYRVSIGMDRDYGDAPDPPYPTLESSGGAYHYVWPGVFLGAGVDIDPDGQPDSLALGDDNDGNDDDDGVTLLTPLVPVMDADVEVVASVPGFVGLWLDANQDGFFDTMFTDRPVSAGANTLSFNVGLLAVSGETYMRVRFTTFPGFTVCDGPAPDGEVEDYRVSIGMDRDYGDAPDPPYPTLESSGGAYHYVWPGVFLGAGVDIDPDGQPDSLALGDDNDGNDDDDGVTILSPLAPDMDVDVEVISSEAGYVGIWIDLEGDGTLDAMLTDTPVYAGANTLSFHLDVSALPGETYMRVRYTTYPGFTAFNGPSPDGEVEDCLVTIDEGWDYGDAPDPSYPTLAASNGASHVIDPEVYLGYGVDAEPDGQPDALALGDDDDGSDDEDGITFYSYYPFSPGNTAQVRVIASVDGFLSVWLDGNEDGDWEDADERVLTALYVTSGHTYVDIPVPMSFTHRETFLRFRFSTSPVLEPTGEAPDGEVEDYWLDMGIDFGDAPDPTYPTLISSGGAEHYIVSGIKLGTQVDDDPDGQPDSLALGDDNAGSDDEDGITFPEQLFIGTMADITVRAYGGGRLSMWLDGNGDGDWDDPGERLVCGRLMSVGTETLSVEMPAGFTSGQTFARFRYASASIYSPSGVAQDGEVEDYAVSLHEYSPASIDIQPASLTFNVLAGEVASDTLIISNFGTENLHWTTREETPPARDGGGAAPLGLGGPDAFGYRWIDSNEPGGPVFDMSMPGTWEYLPLGDDDVLTVALPFPFPFYGETKTQVGITSEGYLTFEDGEVPSYNACIPTTAPPNDLIAPLWCWYDFEYTGYVHYNDSSDDCFGVYYEEMYHMTPMYGSWFQVQLHSNGTILFQYEFFEDYPEYGTIGIENADGSIGLEVACNTLYAEENMAIRIEDPCAWLVENPADGMAGALGSFAVEIWIDATDLAAGVYEGEIVFVSNDAANPEFAVPVTVNVTATGVEEQPVPTEYRIRGNCPNPFNPTTVIAYDLPQSGSVDLRVYDVTGRLVRVLEDGVQREPGTHTRSWDGCDDDGVSVASGVYFCEMSANGETVRGRMVLLK